MTTPVPVIQRPRDMAAWSAAARARGERIAFVPTMGYLHEGHVALLRAGQARADRLVLSIFVNPTQFGPQEDLARYPRDLAGDLAKAASAGVDVAFVPEPPDMYPPGHGTLIDVGQVARGLCGDRRPGHFAGVATVVCKLFNLVQPHVALFGEKDFQQLAVIRRMVADLDLPVVVEGLPTVREPDGLAMSSRNTYLAVDERRRALAISRGLGAARELHGTGERNVAALVAAARSVIDAEVDRVDYVEIRDSEALAPLDRVDGPAVILCAAFVGKTRLIDNLRL